MTLERAVFGNWGVKLLALLLAWGIWFVVREDLDEARSAKLPIVVQRPAAATPEGDTVEGDVVERYVKVEVRGRRGDVATLLAGTGQPLIAPIREDDLKVDQLTGTKLLGPDDLLLPAPLPAGSVKIVSMDPPEVTLRLRRMKRAEMVLRPPEFPGLEELNVKVERRRWPPKAVVRGPADQLTALALETSVDRELLRRQVESMGDSTRATVTFPLTLLNIPAEGFTLVEPRTLEVTVDLVRDAATSVTVPISILDQAGGGGRRLRIACERPWFTPGDPPQVTLELRGSPKSLATVTAQSVRVFLLASELPAGAARGELRVHASDLPSGVSLVRDDLALDVETIR